MARTDTLNNYLTDISAAIKQKRSITDNIQAKNFDEEIQKIESGGVNINGIIEEYMVASGENISAGDFVKFINNAGVDTELSNDQYAGGEISAVLLDSNRVFIAHSHTSGSYYLYGMVCIINGNTITKRNRYSIK